MTASADKSEEQIKGHESTVLSYCQKVHDKKMADIPELAKLELEEIEIELTNILRGEDVGGKIVQAAEAAS
jgi:hypothetical protein